MENLKKISFEERNKINAYKSWCTLGNVNTLGKGVYIKATNNYVYFVKDLSLLFKMKIKGMGREKAKKLINAKFNEINAL